MKKLFRTFERIRFLDYGEGGKVCRDWNVISMIMLQVEAAPTPLEPVRSGDFVNVDPVIGMFNMQLLIDAGFLKRSCTVEGGFCMVTELTWAGCELLDKIIKTAWEKIKKRASG